MREQRGRNGQWSLQGHKGPGGEDPNSNSDLLPYISVLGKIQAWETKDIPAGLYRPVWIDQKRDPWKESPMPNEGCKLRRSFVHQCV